MKANFPVKLLAAVALTAAGGAVTTPAFASAPTTSHTSVTSVKADAPRLVVDRGRRGPCRWSVAYPEYRGADALTTALRKDTRARRDAFLKGATARFCPEGDRLTVSPTTLAASGDVVGVRLTTRIDAAGDGTTTRTYWYDGRTHRVGTLRLLRPGAVTELGALVKRKLTGRQGIEAARLDAALRSPAKGLTDVAFTRSGALRVHFDRDTVAVPPAGAIEVTIGAADVTPLLSDFGRRARDRTASTAGGL
ncbi:MULTISPECIES: hypothetical protein [unclassified Nonomuraea]|uniref:hypothetical protein n=1 Tax=unclassified Nonomuraea TaxID=2593643 RepID=UPI0033DDDBA2